MANGMQNNNNGINGENGANGGGNGMAEEISASMKMAKRRKSGGMKAKESGENIMAYPWRRHQPAKA